MTEINTETLELMMMTAIENDCKDMNREQIRIYLQGWFAGMNAVERYKDGD